MTKNKKIIYTIIAIILIFGIIGIGLKKYIDNKKQKIIEQFKPSMEIYLKTYYNNIDTVTVDDVERVPTGSTCLRGYVNGNKELSIHSFIYYIEENGTLKPVIEIVNVGTLEMDKWRKEEFKHGSPYLAYELLEQQKAKENEKKE
ncbi:Protein of unknown function (DUF1433) [[Clostridium] sordellii]|uniref:DUF1433 domain-containing protein n=1 Tax=Paraclostridium sordellii TaxID=1505 RepID=UPI0005426242|nr:DUF1433 domain-containing protein [Paeniclostridium sordellii]CEK36564.1 Protein of unknown function (DUF1433) [[Clostridium] sordellii] [Paeniclostridium sordellii]